MCWTQRQSETPKKREDEGEAEHRGDDLVLGQDGTEDAERDIKSAGQRDGQRGQADLAPVDGRSRVGEKLQRGQVERDGQPEDEEEA